MGSTQKFRLSHFFSMNRDSIDGDTLNVLKSLDLEKINDKLEIDIKQEELERNKKFIPKLYNLIDKDKSGYISDDIELPILQEILALSAITGNSADNTEAKERTYYYVSIKSSSKTETVAFRSQLRNAAMLGSLPYVMIKQYLLTCCPVMDEFKQMLANNRVSGDWLKDDETTLMAASDVRRIFKNNDKGFSHFLTHYFVWNYKDILKELKGLPSYDNGVDGMQLTFPPIEYEGEQYFVSRYWSESTIIKMIDLLKMDSFVKTDPDAIEKEITVFSDDELNSMSKRKCAFRKA